MRKQNCCKTGISYFFLKRRAVIVPNSHCDCTYTLEIQQRSVLKRLELIQAQIEEMDSRLGKLYDAIEAGEFKGGELAPRIKALSWKKEELLQAKADAEEILHYKSVDMADPQVVQDYADDLRSLLAKSSITEQGSFLKSFVERIEVDESEAKVYYTIPMPPYSVSEETVGVLPFVHHG